MSEKREKRKEKREKRKEKGNALLDAVYIIGTVAFFSLMIAYGRACNALGHEEDEERQHS